MRLTDHPTLFLDLDDVLGDFRGHFIDQFGKCPRSIESDDELWKMLHDHPSFFRDMPLAPGALEFFERVRHLHPVILSACSENHYVHGASQKRGWVQEKLGSDVILLPCRGGKFKHLFMHRPEDVLLDDFHRNIKRWNDAGGVGILHVPHDFKTSLQKIREVIPGVD